VVLPCAGAAGVTVLILLVDRVGRRPMLLLSAGGMTICMLALGLYFRCHITHTWLLGLTKSEWEWVGFVSLIGFMFFNQMGLGPLATLVSTEIVPENVRGLAVGIATW
jgi:MFS family permease